MIFMTSDGNVLVTTTGLGWFILNIPVLHNKHVFSQTCMIFMSSDGNVLVTTTGLGWSAYEQRDNPMGLCPPFSFEIHIN
ncbi:hypothetical protein HanXRQr2_Chr05g0207131 [Helianthus annuus]|uniref:Uncharacterized protein n=1 Tax=Helianthus annuus TaxID=4232 RepID=A0A9K3IY29_HELAN|nr:hypothetical protein HanXRQr2_Chr05g0207131 [Helianthus annuus]KAJ0820295.1 hypothetical protein HanPSC8_Chr16g0706231 [Helianthus annuus]